MIPFSITQPEDQPKNDMNAEMSAADQFKYVLFMLSTPSGAWHFGNDGVVNDSDPMTACRTDKSVDALYVYTILTQIIGNSNFNILTGSTSVSGANVISPQRVFTHGFSQNGMFAGYIGICFHEYITGAWQGGAGMALNDQPPTPPAKQTKCIVL